MSPCVDFGGGVIRSKLNFLRTRPCCISNLRESRMQQHGSKYFARRPLPTPTPDPGVGGLKCQNSIVSGHCHVAYQIKENRKCSNMVAFFARRPPDPGDGPTGQNSTFLEHGHVAYQIKRNHEMQQHGCKYFGCRHTYPTTLGDGIKRSKFNFFRTWSCCISN